MVRDALYRRFRGSATQASLELSLFFFFSLSFLCIDFFPQFYIGSDSHPAWLHLWIKYFASLFLSFFWINEHFVSLVFGFRDSVPWLCLCFWYGFQYFYFFSFCAFQFCTWSFCFLFCLSRVWCFEFCLVPIGRCEIYLKWAAGINNFFR